MNSRYYIIIGVLLLVAACKPSVPSKYIQPDEMEDILVDYHIAKAMANFGEGTQDYNLALYKAAVLEQHGVSEADFDSSMVYYYTRADRFVDIYRRVSERLEERAVALGASEGEISKYSMLKANGDTANIWIEREAAVLMPTPPYNRIDFDYEADTTYRQGDSFLFQFMTDFMYQSGSRDALALLSVTYDNDTTITRYTGVNVSGHTMLRVEPLRGHNVRRVRGFIYLGGGNEQTTQMRLLFLDHLQLIRFHQPEAQQQEANEETNQKDSLKRDTIARREDVAVDGRRDTVGTRRAILQPSAGAPLHRVDVRHDRIKAQP